MSRSRSATAGSVCESDRSSCTLRGPIRHLRLAHVPEKVQVQLTVAIRGISREGNARSRSNAHVAEDHGLDDDRRTQLVVDVMKTAIFHRSMVSPGVKDGLGGSNQLLQRILWERLPRHPETVAETAASGGGGHGSPTPATRRPIHAAVPLAAVVQTDRLGLDRLFPHRLEPAADTSPRRTADSRSSGPAAARSRRTNPRSEPCPACPASTPGPPIVPTPAAVVAGRQSASRWHVRGPGCGGKLWREILR